MKRVIGFLFGMALLVVTACSDGHRVKRLSDVPYETVTAGLYTMMPGEMYCAGDYIVWTDPFSTEGFLHVVDRHMATSKPEKYAGQIAEHFGFDQYFDFIGGACMDGRRTDKHEVIEYVIETCGVSRDAAVMIGDRRHDIIGAAKAEIHSMGVLYGYGSLEELEKAGAEMVAAEPGDISQILLK